MTIELTPILGTLVTGGYLSNTPTEVAALISLSFADFDEGEDRFQTAIDTARHEILFRLSPFTTESYPEDTPIDQAKLVAAQGLARFAEANRAAAILYMHKGQIELQFGESGNPWATPDGWNVGAFTPEKNVQAMEYKRRGNELQEQYEQSMSLIIPNTNKPYLASSAGRSDYTDDGSYWGSSDAWAM